MYDNKKNVDISDAFLIIIVVNDCNIVLVKITLPGLLLNVLSLGVFSNFSILLLDLTSLLNSLHSRYAGSLLIRNINKRKSILDHFKVRYSDIYRFIKIYLWKLFTLYKCYVSKLIHTIVENNKRMCNTTHLSPALG